MKPLLLLSLVLQLACAADDGGTAAQTAPAAEVGSAPAGVSTLGDAEIAAIVVSANAIDAELGDLAAARAERAEVQAFGRTMSRDHRAVNEQAAALVARLGVAPVENEVSRSLRADAAAFRAELEGRTGAAFDRAYVEHEVAFHRAVIEAVDGTLLPNARNPELKQLITAVRPALVAHLEHAQQLAGAVK